MTITLTREEAFEIVEMIECMKLGHKYEGIAEIMSDLLRARLAQPEPEPAKLLLIPALMEQAGWVRKREWQGLTDEEIMEMLDYGQYGNVPQYARNFVDAIEAKLKEKNT
jgi:hypothetical protein